MGLSESTFQPQKVWSFKDWQNLERRLRTTAKRRHSENEIWSFLVREARQVMRSYTTSFFIVSRFLPPEKRAQVEAIYAAVRYPDEIVDTFRLPAAEKMRLLDEWEAYYETGLAASSLREALDMNVPAFLAAFTRVVRNNFIPEEYYRSFLDAMRQDVHPRSFSTLDDLINNYVYGSAVVVGYFLTYVYGSESPKHFERAIQSARSLGIALQLTNFLRDVSEDQTRGRTYLPGDMLRDEGIEEMDIGNSDQIRAILRVVHRLCAVAEVHYEKASADVDAFSPDCLTAINSCILVYRRLNERIAGQRKILTQRQSVPLKEKFRILPISKYWRIPFAYLTR